MIYFTIVSLCMAGLFLTLLEDRFRFWTTAAVSGVVFLLSLFLSFLLGRLVKGPVLSVQLPCIAAAALYLLASFFLSTCNILQKFFVALLSVCSFAFLQCFVPLALGVLPLSAAGAFGAVFSALATLLFYLLLGLCLYRPFRHFKDRGPSGFLLGMCLLLFCTYFLCLGKFDFLFRYSPSAGRLLLAALAYLAMIFCFRSMYQVGRFRERSAWETARNRLMELRGSDFTDLAAAVREVNAAQKSGEYALDTVMVLMQDGAADRIPEYIRSVKANFRRNPVLQSYHENPYLNAVIASKAAFAAQNQIDFSCSVDHETPLRIPELCLLVDEMLTRACRDAARVDGERHLRFSTVPGEDILRFEAVFSCAAPQKERFALKGKKLSDVFSRMFDDEPAKETELRGLDSTMEIVERYGGRLSVSRASEETILQATVRF